MKGFWITFTDGSHGYCEGESDYDAKIIAEKISGKKGWWWGIQKLHDEVSALSGRSHYLAV